MLMMWVPTLEGTAAEAAPVPTARAPRSSKLGLAG